MCAHVHAISRAQVSVSEVQPGQYVVDFGQNMAGITTTTFPPCPAGTLVHYNYGETLFANGSVLNNYGPYMRANYTCSGNGLESYTTQFRCGWKRGCKMRARGVVLVSFSPCKPCSLSPSALLAMGACVC